MRLPPLAVNEPLDLLKLIPEQHFTQPPPRYTEASLVKALEEYGIGRPSTYAPILTTIQARGYVTKNGKQLVPTELGFITNDAARRPALPSTWTWALRRRWKSSSTRWPRARSSGWGCCASFTRRSPPASSARKRRCRTSKSSRKRPGRLCPDCGGALVVKLGRFGKFIACSNYPACRHTEPILVKTGAKCPKCGKDLVERRTKKKRVFYGCAGYKAGDPNSCDFTTWKRPLPQPCPKCGGLLVEAGKNVAQCFKCEERVSLAGRPTINRRARGLRPMNRAGRRGLVGFSRLGFQSGV